MERYIASAGARLWTVASGDEPPLLLLNGSACSDYLEPVADMLGGRRTMIRFEPRGCGRSTRDGNYDLATSMTDLESIRASYDVDRWVLAGHSAGPNLALAYAMYRPDTVEGIVGIAGGNFMNDRDWHRAYDDGLAAGGDETGDLHFDSDPEVLTQLNREWKAFIKSPDVFRRLADLTMPVSLLGAGMDIRPNWPMRQLAELLPHGRYREIPGAGHYP